MISCLQHLTTTLFQLIEFILIAQDLQLNSLIIFLKQEQTMEYLILDFRAQKYGMLLKNILNLFIFQNLRRN